MDSSWLCFLLLTACRGDGVTIHVSTSGDDSSDGSEASPLRTVRAAQAKARMHAGTVQVAIQFGAGTYRLDQTQHLTNDDSGHTYKAKPGSEVTLTGDTPIQGWRTVQQVNLALALPLPFPLAPARTPSPSPSPSPSPAQGPRPKPNPNPNPNPSPSPSLLVK